MREARGPQWTRLARTSTGSSRSPASTRARSSSTFASEGAMRAAVVDRRRRVDEVLAAVRAQPAMAGAALVAGVSPTSRTRSRPRALCASRSSTTAASARSCAGSRAHGAAVDVFPHDVDADTLAGYDGVLLSPGPGDPGAARRRGARRCASCSAARPCSASASAISCSRSRPVTRRSSCRSATAARTTRCSTTARGRVLVTSQNHGFAVAAGDDGRRRRTARSTTAPSRGSTSPSCARGRRSSIPRPARARTTRASIIEQWVEELKAACLGGPTSSRSA